MSKDRLIKLAVFNLGLWLAYILLFSRAFFGLTLSAQNPLSTAFGVMSIVMGVVLFGYVNRRLLLPPPKPAPPLLTDDSLSTLDACAQALSQYIKGNPETFAADLRAAIGQIERMKKKKQTIRAILLDRFTDTEMSYKKFEGAVDSVENIMLLNVKALLRRVSAFDEGEYEDALKRGGASAKLAESRRAILGEYTSFVSRSVEDNEEILIRLDKLILEMAKLGDLHGGAVEDMPAMREIDALIGDTKWYK